MSSYQSYEIEAVGEPYSCPISDDFVVHLSFSGNSVLEGVSINPDGTSHDLPRSDNPLPEDVVVLNRHEISDPEKARQLISDSEFRVWPLSDEHRREALDTVLRTTTEAIARMPSHHNFISLHFRAKLFEYMVFDIPEDDDNYMCDDEEEIDEEEIDLDDEGVYYCMIPATELSIGNLERKKPWVEGCSGCPVCLEEFSSECEVVRLPCSHDFHCECIEEWLRNSHYCPLCRFEMPTS